MGAAADMISGCVVRATGKSGALALTAVLWLVTWALTQVMSNTAACALFCPIGWSVAGYFDTMLLKDFIEHFGVKQPLVLRFFLKRQCRPCVEKVS